MNWDTWQWLIAGLAALMIGMSKTGLGGLGMISIVIMASILPARESTGMILTLLIVADIFAVSVFRRHAQWPLVFRLLPAATLGIVCGFFIMPAIPSGVFGRMIGYLTLVLIGMMLFQRRNPALAEAAAKHGAVLAGWSGGVVTMLANAAGPIMSIYLLACRLPKMEFVGTAAWFFFAVNLIKIPFSVSMGLINADSLRITAILAPLVILGGFFGRWILGKLNQRTFEWIMILLALAGALRLAASG
jgi:uncharacterized membrane protein YfcA